MPGRLNTVLFLCVYCVESDIACGGMAEDADTPLDSDCEGGDEEPVAPLASTSEELGSDLDASTGRLKHWGLRGCCLA